MPEDTAATDSESKADPGVDSETAPAPAAEGSEEPAQPGDTEGQPQAQPQAQPEDLSNLLDSDEPVVEPRVRVAKTTPNRVDHSERMRNYYARIYRPSHNPSRLYFGARAAYALSGTSEGIGGGRMVFANAELGQSWNYVGYAIGTTIMAGSLTFGETGVEQFGPVLVGGGPSLGLGRLSLLGRGYLDARIGYNFFYAPVLATREGMADPPDAAPHGPKLQVDAGLLLHDSESRRFRHGIGASVGWQLLVHSFTGSYPIVNTFNIGLSYFFG